MFHRRAGRNARTASACPRPSGEQKSALAAQKVRLRGATQTGGPLAGPIEKRVVRPSPPSRRNDQLSVGRSSDFRTGQPSLLVSRAGTMPETRTTMAFLEWTDLDARLQRRGRSGFAPDSLFVGRHSLWRTITNAHQARQISSTPAGLSNRLSAVHKVQTRAAVPDRQLPLNHSHDRHACQSIDR